jgi:hypothetical protein
VKKRVVIPLPLKKLLCGFFWKPIFVSIIAQGISAQLLQWKGIEATETLAKSPNAKILVIGNPKNGLPLIMGQE